MMDYRDFLATLSQQHPKLADWALQLPEQIAAGLSESRYGDLPRWKAALAALPALSPTSVQLDASRVGASGEISDEQRSALEQGLKGLHPWRKGPFELYGVHIDTEWRSDWKWDRLKDAIAPLQGRSVLDVGCGSGYHCWRMRGAGAALVVGIDPTPLFVTQYFALQKYLNEPSVAVLPMGIEHLPERLQAFDTTFSMGILYHRRSPFDHLLALRDTLRSGGQLVLETLVIDGELGDALVPEGRYSKMGNVWFIPSTATLESWLKKVGFKNPRLVDVSQTSCDEQRSTEWMQFHSLAEFLDPNDASKTIEGHPAPKRATFIAEAP
ncbi:MAG: tRNA 5-methoxyuridine(34)/uridine 5-oxyacetic acid(34) synthase CmoB [Zhongshania sp.]|uniref:tRNA 5-methoxyuridine(34)/uridine 5-oxyacetic acid(34) synthase CmoB n=1 Tax=Zhongshania sp. TaxID=1971902 RepID=UPI00263542C7|nr:tRNA 5-methoxyuridine(34)/uridine 5-oxyacetic acid(34) synthase CmoB [Zhongshania sp.]MDF1691263.1 tRNA 5-methoxyuridine(34)/uridine 5-oxyacetic acid(34) synthase CmoB [Zhongshania sp.]